MTGGIPRQMGILADRYLTLVLADPWQTLLLLLQAPAIAGLVALRWHGAPQTSALAYVLVLSCLWFGVINSCREIVKERAIFERERLLGLSILAYVGSKLQVLALLTFVQCLLLQGTLHYWLGLNGPPLLLFATLWLTSLAGVALGLLISAISGTPDRAVSIAPLVTIPQILFSRLILPEATLTGWARPIEKMMILRWAFDGADALVQSSWTWWPLWQDWGALLGFLIACGIGCTVVLASQEPT
ncbi:MAG: ABC transporter permease [Candidatus Sericytochromatia bacterium]|nr:ABC transporter permease [Candidatus Sericytochromatia bacterium]